VTRDLGTGAGLGRTWALSGLIAAIVAAHVALIAAPAWRPPLEFALGVIPARFDPHSPYAFQNWIAELGPLFGHVFLHAPSFFLHIGMNMLVLAQVGGPPNRRLGAFGFLALFFGSAAAAAGAYVLGNPGSTTPAIGASGAVSGVFGAFLLAARPSWRDALRDRRVLLTGFWFLAINVGLAFLAARSGVLPIAWEAHLGGFLAGLALYPPLLGLRARRA